MKKSCLLFVMLIAFGLIFSACGGKEAEEAGAETTEKAAAEKSAEKGKSDLVIAGEAVAKEILETFDQLVADTVALVKDKPEPDAVKPQLEAVHAKYTEKMQELNVKYLALRDADVESWGAANGYLGENRGKHVWDRDMAVDAYIVHYRGVEGGEEVVQFLTKEIINLLEVAVKR